VHLRAGGDAASPLDWRLWPGDGGGGGKGGGGGVYREASFLRDLEAIRGWLDRA
jgi:hypothetical protein